MDNNANGNEIAKIVMTYNWLNRQTSWNDGTRTEKQIYRGMDWKRTAILFIIPRIYIRKLWRK